MDAEVINIGESAAEKLTANYGGGIELLMNEKRIQDKENAVGNVDALENELNELTDINDAMPSEPFVPEPSIGRETADIPTNARTWDGYENLAASTTFNPDVPNGGADVSEVKMSKEELLREKFACLRRLEELEKKGVRLTKHYTMESSLSEMQGEYETIISEKERSNSVKFQAKVLMACITGVEFLNNKFDPFDIKLDGWSEQINENISDYDEVFSELHEKYKSKGKMAPELKLMFQLAGSAMMIHMTNTMFKSAVPGMDDIMKQNPELMQQFTRAAANSMSDSKPGFSNFMNMTMDESSSQPPPRQSMKGPSDVDDIISNMKTKISKDVHAAVEENYYSSAPQSDSNISIQDLKDLAGQKMPRKSKKKKDSVTVSLDM